MTRNELILACSTAALSFAGATLGVYLSSHFDQQNWTQRFVLEQKKAILDKRVSLIERTVTLLNEEPIEKGLRGDLDMDEKLAAWAVQCAREKIGAHNNCNPRSLPIAITNLSVQSNAEEMYKLNAQLVATVSLDAIFFGPATKQAVRSLNSDGRDGLWSSAETKRQALINAMARELNWFPR